MIIADFSKKNLVKENKTQKLRKSAICEGDLEERCFFSGKEVEWTEGNFAVTHFRLRKPIIQHIPYSY